MPVLNKANKDRLIGGLIGVILLLLTLWVKSLFDKTGITKPPTVINSLKGQSNVITNDSSQAIVNNAPIQQQNNNKGNVNNNSHLDNRKIINDNSTKNSTIIKNTRPLQRHVDSNDLNKLLNFIPSKETLVVILFPVNNREGLQFGKEISKELWGFGYKKITLSPNMVGDIRDERFSLGI